MKVSVDYTWLGKVENEIRSSDYPLLRIDYAESVELFLYVPVPKEAIFVEWITELTNGQAKIERETQDFIEFDTGM
jgi:putative IMPACT (imprinted ancient) family translation regulator